MLLSNKEIDPTELDFLLRYLVVPNAVSPVDFLSHNSWGGIKALSNLEGFRNLDRDIEGTIKEPFRIILRTGVFSGSAKRWKKFVDSETPENEKYPGDWKNKTLLQKLCMMRALRPDRMTYAML